MRRFFLLLLLLSQIAVAVNLTGIVYGWEDLMPVPGAIIKVMSNSSVVSQTVTDENGTYILSLDKGNYDLNTLYMNGSEVKYFSSDLISIISEQDTIFDIVLFPPTEETIPDIELMNIPIVDINLYDNASSLAITGQAAQDTNLFYILIILLSSGVGAASAYLLKSNGKATQIPETKETPKELPKELSDIVEMMRKEGGRIQQKSLQKTIGLSASKVSLLITDLESRGVVKRIKRGRGNVLILEE